MSELDWRRPLEEVLGDDETARRQLAEHAQLLPIADARTSLRFMAARLREHWVSTLLTLVITIGGAVAAAILPRLIGSAVDVVAAAWADGPGLDARRADPGRRRDPGGADGAGLVDDLGARSAHPGRDA